MKPYRHVGAIRQGSREICCQYCDRGAVIRWRDEWLCAAHFYQDGAAKQAASLARQRRQREELGHA